MSGFYKKTVDLYDDSVVIDGLNVSNWDSPAVFSSLNSGGVTAINATVATWENYDETIESITQWKTKFESSSQMISKVTSTNDILNCKKTGKTGIILGFQNASPIENDLDNLVTFYDMGVRIIQVTYHERNLLGNGCYERRDDGLSSFGIDAVKEMNRLGILMDLSHVGIKTTIDTIEVSDKPVSCTHANSKAYYDVPRNKADDALKLLAEKGGVVGATCITSFLQSGRESNLRDYIEAIDRLVDSIGVEHVGIGTDFTQDQPVSFWRYISSQQGTKYPATFIDPDQKWVVNDPALYPAELQTPDDFRNVALGLHDMGYEAGDIRKILGGNWLRLFDEVWGV